MDKKAPSYHQKKFTHLGVEPQSLVFLPRQARLAGNLVCQLAAWPLRKKQEV